MIGIISKLFRRELKGLFYDKGLIMLLVGGPLFYSFFYPFPYKNAVVRDIPVAVIDMDRTPNSRQLIRMMDATEEISTNDSYTSIGAAEEDLLKRKIHGIVYIEKDFQKNILKGKPQKVKLYSDASYIIYYKQVSTAVQKAVKTMSAGVEIKKLQAKGAGKAAYTIRSPINLITKNLYNPSGGYVEYVVPAVFIVVVHQILLMAIGMRAGTLKENKKRYRQDVSVWHILFAKTGVYMCFGLGYFLYFFVIMYRFWGLTGGYNILGMFIFFVPFLLSVIFLGIWISGYFKYRESSTYLLVVTSLPIVFMSGALWPAYLMPAFIRGFRLLFPSTYGVDGVIRLFIMDAPFSAAAGPFAALCGLCVLYGFFAYRTIKKRYPLKI
ncbi:ABC-2 type transport system permease protein [Elusimicrobium posterum]|uniref:ABC transporter permease n=1 Tax=Elusimicrobium posterum TaxID=3116653 RepID=UPI003C77437D